MSPVLTPRMVLRKLVAGDLDALVELDSDRQVMRYISGGYPTPREDYEDHLLERMLRYDDPRSGFFAAERDGAFIGWFHLRPSVVEPEILELGYRLRRDAWGQGLATEGALALCAVAFDEHDMPRVDACAVPDNAGSIAVMRKCGMNREREFIHPRAPVTCVRYVVERDAWRSGRSRSAG